MRPLGFPNWEELYRSDTVEALPWYWPTIDPDLEAALARHGVDAGRALDQGTGPGTQAIALAERGFTVTATDVSPAALAYAARKAIARGITVTFVEDDVLAPRLDGPFDVIFDRGCFHVIAPEMRSKYVEVVHRRLAPSGWLFLKTFSHLQPERRGRTDSRRTTSVACSATLDGSRWPQCWRPSTKGNSIRIRTRCSARSAAVSASFQPTREHAQQVPYPSRTKLGLDVTNAGERDG